LSFLDNCIHARRTSDRRLHARADAARDQPAAAAGRRGSRTHFTIADPEDPGMLDIVGFDTATPEVVSGFALGVV
jgi:hypothetical protein